MPNLTLPKEVLSLIHHVELNKAGWWEKAVQRLILAAIWLLKENATLQTVLECLCKEFQVSLNINQIRAQIDVLCRSGIVVLLPNDHLKISEQALKEFEKDLQEAEEIEAKVKRKFLVTIRNHCPSLQPEETWETFHDELLVPLIREMGVRTYELISGTKVNLDVSSTFPRFLQGFPAEFHEPLRNAIITFLDPKDSAVRSYILRSLNAYFFVEAIGLAKETLDSLIKAVNLKPSFAVFVDTNFLFSILGLHENPSNSGKVTVNLYVLPITIDETRRVLAAAEQELSGLRLTPNLADAALEAGLSGITRRFVEESKTTGGKLSPADYFYPYKTNLIQVLRDKGVEFFNAKIDDYKTEQEVIDDIMAQLEFEVRRYGKRAKTYEALEHDMVLWHFVQDKRPARVESPLEAKYFIVTVDYRFLGFDAFKRSEMEGSIPVCLHPSAFIQMLQFWVPRTPQFEEAMLSSMKLPFLFREFDPDAERVTIRILEILGRFENVGDLPQETVTSVLLNEALRQRLSAESDMEKQVQLVKEALIEEYQKTYQKLKETVEEAESLKGKVVQKEATIQKLQQEMSVQKKKLEEERKARKALENKIQELEESLRVEKEKQKRRKFIRNCLSALVLLVGLLGTASWVLAKLTPVGFWSVALGIWSLGLIFWVWLIGLYGSKDFTIREWRLFRLFQKARKWLFSILGLILVSVLSNIVWELLKKMIWQ